jgi:ketol-acid reductoisomerase
MPAKIYYDNDADLSLLKNKTIAILGFGSQGHAQAQNLRDSGCKVIVSELPGTPNFELAKKSGFDPLTTEEAVDKGDLIQILLPDEIQGDVYRNRIRDHLRPGNILMCSHGFNIHFGQIEPPQRIRQGGRRTVLDRRR